MPRAAVIGLSVTAVAVLAIAGVLLFAGGGKDASGDSTALLVTQDFGAETLIPQQSVPLGASPTAMRQIQSAAEVETQYGGRYVQSIDGVEGDGVNDWLFYVDGVQSDVGAASVTLTEGQLVQWDRHDWQALRTGGAIVGAFPRPLKQRGVAIKCVTAGTDGCDLATARLDSLGVRIVDDGVPVYVGLWRDVATQKLPRKLIGDPVENGVFAAPGENGLRVINDQGKVARELGDEAGLVAAVGAGGKLAWIVTGTTLQGVEVAAGALQPDRLFGRFAVAVDEGTTIGLPEASQ